MSDPRTLPLPDPGPTTRGAVEHARSARRQLRLHQLQWVAMTMSVAAGSVPGIMPPGLSPTLATLGIALAVRAWLRARSQRAELLTARGPAPESDLLAAVTWRADPRGGMAEGFRRARNWWLGWTLGALLYLGVRIWWR